MKTEPVVSDLAEHEFDVPCCSRTCSRAATWSAWASHNTECREGTGLVCDADKAAIEQAWIDDLDSFVCTCGWRCTGQLSDHFRAIRL